MEVLKHLIKHVLLWEFRQGNNTTLMNKPCEMYDSDTLSLSQRQRWFQHFRPGNYSLKDEQRSGRPQEFYDDLLQMIVEQNSSVTVEELAEQHINPFNDPSASAKGW